MRMEGRGYGLFDKTITIDAWDVVRKAVLELCYDMEHGNNYVCDEDLARYFAAAVWLSRYKAQYVEGWDWEKTAHARLFVQYFTEIVVYDSLYTFSSLGAEFQEGLTSKFAQSNIQTLSELASVEWKCQQLVFEHLTFEDMGDESDILRLLRTGDVSLYIHKDSSPRCMLELAKHFGKLWTFSLTEELIKQYGIVACMMLDEWHKQRYGGNLF